MIRIWMIKSPFFMVWSPLFDDEIPSGPRSAPTLPGCSRHSWRCPLAFGNDNGWCGMYQLGTSSTEFWGFTKWSFLEIGEFFKTMGFNRKNIYSWMIWGTSILGNLQSVIGILFMTTVWEGFWWYINHSQEDGIGFYQAWKGFGKLGFYERQTWISGI